MRKSSLIVAVLVFLSVLFIGMRLLPEARATTLYVGGIGPNNYTTIQEAINDAIPGDTVLVYNGTYTENVVLNKTLTLVGEDANITIINGGLIGPALNVTADWANVTGFNISSGGAIEYTGLEIYHAHQVHIHNNTLWNSEYGIIARNSTSSTMSWNVFLKNDVAAAFADGSNNMIERNYFHFHSHGLGLLNERNDTVAGNYFRDCDDGISVVISSGNVVLNNTVNSTGEGIWIYMSHNNQLIGNTVTGASYSGFTVANSTNNTITSNNLSLNPGHGIFLDFSRENVIANNTFTHNQIGMKLDFSNNDTIAFNMISSNAAYGVDIDSSNDNTFANNSFSDNLDNFVFTSSDRNKIIDNNFSEGVTGLYGYASRSSIIANNSVYSNSYGIYLHSSGNNTMTGNALWNNSDGFYIHSSDFNTIAGNNASGGWRGVRMVYSRSNTITNNTFKPSFWDAISIVDSIGNTVRDNTMIEGGIVMLGDHLVHWNTHTIDTSNTLNGKPVYYWKDVNDETIPLGAGQVILANCSNVRVEYQNMSNGSAGVLIGFSSDNVVVNNTLWGNLAGVYVNASSNNQIYHNNFINNSIYQAFDDRASNQWDNGYPSGGNYWSDYGGVDNCSGPNQDVCPDPDGIGDTPYYERWYVNDRYPLMGPFEHVSPQPPRNLRAILSGKNSENVTLTWSLSFDDGAGLMLVTGYEIYRNGTYDSTGLGYQLIATLPNGTSDFVDSYAGDGDPEQYFYTACAVDLTSNRTCSSRQAAKFTRPLTKGPNLLSIPLVQSNESIKRVLQTVKWEETWSIDSLSQEWKSYMKQKTYKGELLNVDHTIGFWINVTEDSNLTVAGVVPAQTTIHLHKGWNLVSFPSFLSFSVSDLKAVAPAERVEAFDSSAPPHFLRVLADSDVLLAGQGYWVKTSADATWVVSNA